MVLKYIWSSIKLCSANLKQALHQNLKRTGKNNKNASEEKSEKLPLFIKIMGTFS